MVEYLSQDDPWHGEMRLDPKTLNSGDNAGEELGRSNSRKLCRPYSVYKAEAPLLGVGFPEALEREQARKKAR